MTKMFLEINDDSYFLEHLTYDPETKVYKILTERVGDWRKVNFKCPEEWRHYSFTRNPLFQPATRTNEQFKPNYQKKQIEKLMTFELELRCIWQHPTVGSHLETTKIV